MPFTTSHPGIVLPLKKMYPRYFSLTGLMAGAMAPDLLYFLMASTVYRGLSHSWAGLFLFCIPAGVAFSFAFHWLFKYNFIINLPAPFDGLLSGLAVSKWQVKSFREWVVFLVSVFIGVLSHFGWDSFTHVGGEIASRYTFLKEQVTIFQYQFHLAEILQHLSTLFGAFVIIYYALKGWLLPKPSHEIEQRTYSEKLLFWSGCMVTTILFMAVVMVIYQHFFPWLIVHSVVTVGLASWAGIFWSVIGYTILKCLLSRNPLPANRF